MLLTERKRVCILVFSDIVHDGRVLREVEYARRYYEVDVLAHGQWNPPDGVRFFPLPRTTWSASPVSVALLLAGNRTSRAWEKYYWQRREYWDALDLLRNGRYDLIHANDLDTLPVAVKAAEGSNTRVLYDAHEYSLDAGGESWRVLMRSPFHKYLLKTYGPKISAMITVADGIRNLYRSHFQFDSKVIMNAPYYREHEFRPVHPSHINLVHHGGAIPGRNIQDFISMMPMLDDRFHLQLMLVPVYRSYHATLQHLAEKVAPDRIHFLTPVTPNQITDVVNRFDIGIPLMRVNKLSFFNALPNKFFEYIMAGVAIAVSPLPEMERIVKEHKIGVISPGQSIDSMVKMLNGLSPDQINEFKRNSLSLAKTLNGDVELQKLMDIYAGLLSA